jgi:hypothetical protein
MKRLLKHAIPITLLASTLLATDSTSGATREYAFAGPSLNGRFVVEEFTSPTPICETCDDYLIRDFAGQPFSFSAKAGEDHYMTTLYRLDVYNQMVAFGRSDFFKLSDEDFSFVLMGPSLFNPFTTTLPHDLESYSGLHFLQLRNAQTGDWMEYQIESLVALPVLSIAKSSTRLTLRWPASNARFVLESTENLSPEAVWSEVMNVGEPAGGTYSVTIAPEMPGRFFRLRLSQ